jgi:hypothetical protein
LEENQHIKRDVKLMSRVWSLYNDKPMKCPECGENMIVSQAEPIDDFENPYVPYDTVLECTSCPFKVRAESFSLLGGVKDFDLKNIEIGSWSPSGSRVLSNYEHLMNYDVLKDLKKSGDLVEFLVVNKHVVDVIK